MIKCAEQVAVMGSAEYIPGEFESQNLDILWHFLNPSSAVVMARKGFLHYGPVTPDLQKHSDSTETKQTQ